MKRKELLIVKAKELTVLPHIQRRLNATRVNKLVKNWKPNIVGTLEAIELDYEDETIWHIVDGQHRWAAAMQIDPTMELAVVITYGSNDVEGAEFFLARNQESSKVPAFDRYEVGIVAMDPVALSIRKALDATNLKAGEAPGPSTVAAISGMMTVVKKGDKVNGNSGANILTQVLRTLMNAWPEADGVRFNGDILKAVGIMLVKHPDIDIQRLESKMGDRTPDEWMIDAKALTRFWSGEGRATILAGMFTEAYNYRLRKAAKLG